jgi:methionyl-tRNA synthetase
MEASILAQCLESVRIALLLLEPFLPQKMSEFSTLLGMPSDAPWNIRTQWGYLKPGSSITKVALYPRVEIAKA